ncbi:MAG: excinuclease ABC subunit UvrA [bacterium]
MKEEIRIIGARQHNLKNLTVALPRHQLIVMTGPSGSGKSSLAFDTLYAEGQRRYAQSLSARARQFLEQMDKPDVDAIEGLSPAIAIEQRASVGGPRSTVATATEIYDYLRLLYVHCGQRHHPQTGKPLRRLTAQEIADQIMEHPDGSPFLLLAPVVRGQMGGAAVLERLRKDGYLRARVNGVFCSLEEPPKLSKSKACDIDAVVDRLKVATEIRPRLADSLELAFKSGKGVAVVHWPNDKGEGGADMWVSNENFDPETGYHFPELAARHFSFNHPLGACPACHGLGVQEDEKPCAVCGGGRLKPEALAVTIPSKIGGAAKAVEKNITDFCRLTIAEAADFLAHASWTKEQRKIAFEAIHGIEERLRFLQEVGLAYLTLDRETRSLSGGEAQRIRLATQIGSGLTGVLYVLDEPSIGLHPSDQQRLLSSLKRLRDLGNTVVVVEHDEATMRQADLLLDLGPCAGAKGGYLIAQGTAQEIQKHPQSLTGRYLSGALRAGSACRRAPVGKKWLKIIGAREHNLKNINVSFPLGLITCVTGVSGSGKSTLVNDILGRALFRHFYRSKEKPGAFERIEGLKELDRAVMVDQAPIGRSPRSNALTYTGAFDVLRGLFAKLPASRMRGYTAGRFSFNAVGGRCEHCEGDGIKKIEMSFLPNASVTCPVCQGDRFNRETLEITYKGRNIAEVLRLTVGECLELFQNIPALRVKLETLARVGLDYLPVGQAAPTLSGGEAQRVKLAAELSKRAEGRSLFILDEPTTGLHFAEIDVLLRVLTELRDAGHTLIVIEHQLDVIRCADYVIDLGPGGGEAGGRVTAAGTPEEIAACKESQTGVFLKKNT